MEAPEADVNYTKEPENGVEGKKASLPPRQARGRSAHVSSNATSGRSRVQAELDMLRDKNLAKTNKDKFKGSSVPLSAEEAMAFLAAQKQKKGGQFAPPVSSGGSGDHFFDSWYMQQKAVTEAEKKKKSEAEALLRGYRAAHHQSESSSPTPEREWRKSKYLGSTADVKSTIYTGDSRSRLDDVMFSKKLTDRLTEYAAKSDLKNKREIDVNNLENNSNDQTNEVYADDDVDEEQDGTSREVEDNNDSGEKKNMLMQKETDEKSEMTKEEEQDSNIIDGDDEIIKDEEKLVTAPTDDDNISATKSNAPDEELEVDTDLTANEGEDNPVETNETDVEKSSKSDTDISGNEGAGKDEERESSGNDEKIDDDPNKVKEKMDDDQIKIEENIDDDQNNVEENIDDDQNNVEENIDDDVHVEPLDKESNDLVQFITDASDAEEKKEGAEDNMPESETLQRDTKESQSGHDTTWRNFISREEGAKFAPEPNRYHLYVANACPWAHRTMMARAIKGLEDVISYTAVHPIWKYTRPDIEGDEHRGWVFANPDDEPFSNTAGLGGPFPPVFHGNEPDIVNNCGSIRDLYEKAKDTIGKYTVPVLWDKKLQTIVSNESSEIIRMFNKEFNEFAKYPGIDLYPDNMKKRIDSLNRWIYPTFNNGVYRCGLASTQEKYMKSVTQMTASFDKIEEILKHNRFIAGDTFTEADVRLFPTLLRFDEVYNVYFKTNSRFVARSDALLNYCREIYQMPGIAETCDMEQIKYHYYCSHVELNRFSIVPIGAGFMDSLSEPHNRALLEQKNEIE